MFDVDIGRIVALTGRINDGTRDPCSNGANGYAAPKTSAPIAIIWTPSDAAVPPPIPISASRVHDDIAIACIDNIAINTVARLAIAIKIEIKVIVGTVIEFIAINIPRAIA